MTSKIIPCKKIAALTLPLAALLLSSIPAQAAVSEETAFVFNTFSFLVNGALVMWMAAGFAMLEAGLVRSKNTAAICLKNIALYSIAGLMFYLVGYNLLYVGVGENGLLGTFSLFYDSSAEEFALLSAEETTEEMIAAVTANGYSVMSDWFFQMVFVAATASIVSGTLAERIKFWPFMAFIALLTAVIYPIQASWSWGGGWLSELGFSDFAGSSIVHSVGGWAALTGAIILGARTGKFSAEGRVKPIPGSNLPLATLGTFILWMGWFGFNGGSQLALGSASDAVAMAIVFVNTNIAAAAGVVVAMALTQLLYKKIDLTMALNGALAGLVSITAGPDVAHAYTAIIIGGIGGAIVVFTVPLLDALKIDDVVGAIPVHLFGGIWGTLAVGIFGSSTIIAQITGIIAIGGFTIVCSSAVWLTLKYTVGIRVTEEEEYNGLDLSELGLEAYPEFGRGSQKLL
ncbi:ammonium transporter [Kiloniella laminariae]|uniref:ammonium transporter n=1 Tax=Kiloniella laminariae TaxID=454162 RepID=UPI000399FBA4|nr:ammonium transporter [Kiloniella laminariae]